MSRISDLRSGFGDRMDGLLVTCEKNQRYLSGFSFTDGYILVTREHAYMLVDFRYIEAAKKFASDELEVVQLKGNYSSIIGQLLGAGHICKLGYEDSFLTCAALERFRRNFPLLDFEPVGNLLDGMREFKDARECACIIRAQRIAEAALENLLKALSPNMTERDVALELDYFMLRAGAEAPAFKTIAVSGSASSLPHGEPRDRLLEKGFLTLDFGAVYDGYCSDMTRTVCIGAADFEQKHIYSTVLAAQRAALAVINDGVDCGEADRAARDLIGAAGFGESFGHGLGHGVGIYIHEEPRLSPSAAGKTLKPGHVVTVEPGIYLEGRYGVRIEDMVIIGKGSAEDITLAPKELIEII